MILKINKWARLYPARAATLTGWYQQLCSTGSAFLIVPVVIGTLGNEVAGIWFSLQGFIAIFGLSDFGFSMAISRQVAHSLNLNHNINLPSTDLINTCSGWNGIGALYTASKTIFVRVLAVSIILFVLTYELILPWTNLFQHRTTDITLVWYLLAGSFASIFMARLSQSFLEGLGYMYVSRLISGSYQLLCGIFSIVVLKFGFGLVGLAVVLFIGSLVQLWAMHSTLMQISPVRLVADFGDTRPLISELWKVAVPFGLVNSGVYLVGAAQVPLLGVLLGPTVIAPIYLAVKISQVFNATVLQITTAQLPSFTQQCAQGHWSLAKKRMLQTLAIGGVLQILMAFFLFFGSPKLVELWVGPNHYIGGMVLFAFSVNYAITCLAGLPAQFVLASGRNPFALSTLMHGIITIGGMIVVCPKIGLLGVPLAGLVAIILTNLWLNPLEAWRTWQILCRFDNLSKQNVLPSQHV
ncbi:MAG: hypothetical protein JJE30_15520 [Desulfuromonadales bacterium]|nr:hypothetical protein [Desulfuromonadales bacterium]